MEATHKKEKFWSVWFVCPALVPFSTLYAFKNMQEEIFKKFLTFPLARPKNLITFPFYYDVNSGRHPPPTKTKGKEKGTKASVGL